MPKNCINGKVNPSAETKLRLFADAAGHCSRPECHRYLFSDLTAADYHIGEIAHMIAASNEGPRPENNISPVQKAKYDNLILLCPSCHTEIDKAPEVFPIDLIRDWKALHRKRIIETIGLPKFCDRQEARNFVARLLQMNRAIFVSLNPDLPYRENPEAEEAVVWKRKMVSKIIPNSQKILLFLEVNVSLLNEEEVVTLEEFHQHVDDLIERHLGDNVGIATRFPRKMDNILTN